MTIGGRKVYSRFDLPEQPIPASCSAVSCLENNIVQFSRFISVEELRVLRYGVCGLLS